MRNYRNLLLEQNSRFSIKQISSTWLTMTSSNTALEMYHLNFSALKFSSIFFFLFLWY